MLLIASLRIRPRLGQRADVKRGWQRFTAEQLRAVLREIEALVRSVRRLRSSDMVDILVHMLVENGNKDHSRSENGREFVADTVQIWLRRRSVVNTYIKSGRPWENGYIENFNIWLQGPLANRNLPPQPRRNAPHQRF